MSSDSKLTVLLVDDEDKILKSLKRLLRDEDFEIITAQSGMEGLELAKAHKPALVVSDQRMPGMTGVELFHKLREIMPDTIRILLTGYADASATIEAINSSAVRYYLNKPWDDEDFLSRIHESLDLYSTVKENKRLQELTISQNEQLIELNENLEKKVQEQTSEIRERHKELNVSFMETIKAFSTFLELRHKDVGSHSQRVAAMARTILADFDLNEKERQDVIVAAYLHDIGKISLPDSLLRVSFEDYRPRDLEQIKRHPILGQTCVYNISGFEEIGVIIRHHHENYDGTGYPDGLSHHKIPLGSRIIRLCDAFDHFSFAHGYPDMKTLNAATGRLVQFSGSDFDSELVTRFVEHELAKRMYYGESSDTVTLKPNEVEEGMVVTEDINTRNGMFLLPKGAKLSRGMIKRICKIHAVDPIVEGIRVYRQIKTKEMGHVL